jgi:hypothetical protein
MVAIFWLSMLIRISLEQDFFYHPRQADILASETVPFETKGVLVYVTPNQNKFLLTLDWLLLGSGLMLVIPKLFEKVLSLRKKHEN